MYLRGAVSGEKLQSNSILNILIHRKVSAGNRSLDLCVTLPDRVD